MIERLLFMSALFKLVIASLGQAQYESNIVARGFSNYNNSKVEVHFTDYNENGWVKKIYSSIVVDGRFEIKTTMMNPSCKGFISFPLQKRQYLLILDSGILQVELPAGQKINPNLVKTSPTNDLFWKVNRIKIEHQSDANQSVRDLRLKTLQVIKDNPNNYYSLIELGQLSYLIFSLKPEEIIAAFESLEENNKQTNMGLWLGNKLKEYGNALEGKHLPIFSLFDETGMPFSNEHIPEKVNLLAFTAYWCGPCKKQIPILKRFQEEFGQDKFNVIYINLDADKSKWEKMVQDYQLSTFINLTDTVNMEQSIMAKRFFINALPTNILIDRNQKILYNSSQLGDLDLVLIKSYLKKAIDEIPISYDIPNNK